MMKRLYCSGWLLMLALCVSAVIPDMKFRRLDSRDGLKNTQVNCIRRDSRGFMWIGTTYGLDRYDGYRFKVYYSHANDTLSMLRNNVSDVQEDIEGRLWIYDGVDYSVMDPVTERFDRHPERWLHEQGIPGSIERIHIDRHGHYWVKTYHDGLWVFNKRQGLSRQFTFGNEAQQLDPQFGVSDIWESGNSLLMISNNGEIVCLNTHTMRISWKSNKVQTLCNLRNVFYAIRTDAKKNIWVLTEGRSFVFVRSLGKWVSSATEALQLMGIEGFPSDMKIWDIASDKHQQLWLATDHFGLWVVSLSERQKRQFLTVRNDETTISDNTLRKIYRDQLDRMWIATYMNGVNFYSENLFHFRNIEAGNINTVCIDQQGDYWMGSNDNGIIYYNRKTGEQTVFNKSNSAINTNVIVSSLAASDGSLWFGTYGGGLIAWRNGHFTNYQMTGQKADLAHNSVWALCEDQWGYIWLGTLGGGLQRLDPKTGKFSIPLNSENSKLASNYVSSIQLTEDGRLLIGHSNFYSWVDPKTMTVRNCTFDAEIGGIPSTPYTNQILQDSRGLLWQATMTGVTIYDTKRDRIWLFDRDNGLSDSMAGGLIEDARHTIWIITMHGISNVIPQLQSDGNWTFTVRNYNSRDGLQTGPFNQRSAALASNGFVLVGGHQGLDIINPKDLGVGMVREHPKVSGVKIVDAPVRNIEGSLQIDYADNLFTLQLATDNGEAHNRTRFAYRLLGFNNQWLYADVSQPTVTYTGLPSGNYTFELCILQEDGMLDEQPYRLSIEVLPPWYRSWWMLGFYFLLLAAFVGWLYRRSQDKLRLERMKMEQENRHQMAEMQQHFYETVSDELRQPFQNAFDSLNGIMQRETDEQRYEQQQLLFNQMEQLLEQVNKLFEDDAAKKKMQPQIQELEIVSLDEQLVKDATCYVEDNLDNADISVETMAEALAMSRVHLYKKLTSLTDLTPSEFIRQIRLQHAEQLLRKSQLTVAEVAYRVGFNNPRYFSKYFKEMYGMMPSEYKNTVG